MKLGCAITLLTFSILIYFLAGISELLSPIYHFMYADKFLFSGYQEDINVSFHLQGLFLLVTGGAATLFLFLSVVLPCGIAQSSLAAGSLFLTIISTIQEFVFMKDTSDMPDLIKKYINLNNYYHYDDIPTESDIDRAGNTFAILGILKAISILAPLSQVIYHPKSYLTLFSYIVLFGIFIPFPIYTGYLALSNNYKPISIILGYRTIYMAIMITGAIALVGLILFGVFFFTDIAYYGPTIVSIGAVSAAVCTIICYQKKPKETIDLTKMTTYFCNNTISEKRNNCLRNAYLLRKKATDGSLFTTLSIPYIILFGICFFYFLVKFLAICVCVCCQGWLECLADFVTNSKLYIVVDEEGREIEYGRMGWFGYSRVEWRA